MDLNVFQFDADRPGPHLLILGGVHGNEPCGTVALMRIKDELDHGHLKLLRGRLTIVPVCNPAARAHNVRYVDLNLNRIIGADDLSAAAVEATYATQIAQLIDHSDVLLDLHSYSSGKRPFLFLDHDDAPSVEFAKILGIPSWVTGWPELYQGEGASMSQGDTATYAYAHGTIGLVVECGTHTDPAASHVALNSVRRALAYLAMIPQPEESNPIATPSVYKVTNIITRSHDGVFKEEWQHLDPITKGDDLIIFDDGSILKSPFDGVIILPDRQAHVGHEWLYLGHIISIGNPEYPCSNFSGSVD